MQTASCPYGHDFVVDDDVGRHRHAVIGDASLMQLDPLGPILEPETWKVRRVQHESMTAVRTSQSNARGTHSTCPARTLYPRRLIWSI